MPGKLEKLEMTASALLEAGLIDSLEEFDVTTADLATKHYTNRRHSVEQAVSALHSRVIEGMDAVRKGDYITYDSPKDCVRAARERFIKRKSDHS